MSYVDGFVLPVPEQNLNAKVMADPRMKKIMESGPMPFDAKRMVYGGFKSLVDM